MLKALLARSSFEMDKCVERGEVPAFGFPAVCFSPIADNPLVTDKEKFWQKLYLQTIRDKRKGHRSSIVK